MSIQQVGLIVSDVLTEFYQETENTPAFKSPEEGFGAIQDAVDRVRFEVQPWTKSTNQEFRYVRARYVAVMAIRFMQDCCPRPATPSHPVVR